ncbi:MAG: YggT family protein [Streptococcaceae bacterium]|jgi:YggT family protein|nr:YggT family protein [Streptococcaceae bacterium]
MMILYYIVYGIYRLITIYIWILVIYALMSWLPGLSQSRFGYWVNRLVQPYLRLFDKIPTRFGVFDFQVFLAVFLLILVQRLLLLIF